MPEVITQDFIDGLAPVFTRWSNEALAAETADLSEIAQVVNTPDHDQHTYAFSGFPPALSRWISQRERSDLNGGTITVENERFAATIDVERRLIETDRLDLIKPKIQMLGLRGRQHMGKFLAQLLLDGFDSECWDGSNFFDSDHEFGNSGQQNNMTSDALTPDSLWDALTEMGLYLDDQGEPLGIKPTYLIHGPTTRRTVAQIMEGQPSLVTGLGSTSSASVIQDPNVKPAGMSALETARIRTDQWFLVVGNLPVKSLIWQWGRGMQFRSVTDLNDSKVFETDEFSYGVDCWSGMGYGEPLLAYGSDYGS